MIIDKTNKTNKVRNSMKSKMKRLNDKTQISNGKKETVINTKQATVKTDQIHARFSHGKRELTNI